MTDYSHFPLEAVIETKSYPHARTLRTSFAQKLWDTFNAFAGEAPVIARKPHTGIFDYLTLYIPIGFLHLMGWCFDRPFQLRIATLESAHK